MLVQPAGAPLMQAACWPCSLPPVSQIHAQSAADQDRDSSAKYKQNAPKLHVALLLRLACSRQRNARIEAVQAFVPLHAGDAMLHKQLEQAT